jgi:hypothetical protein
MTTSNATVTLSKSANVGRHLMITTSIFVFWLLPVLVAWGRGVRWQTIVSIAVLCVFLGILIVPWVLALIWSLEAPCAR